MFLEVIAANIDDIKQINKTNADRIEFCKNLEVGGLTPDIEDIILANQVSQKPINVMVRTSYDDFFFSDYELSKQIETISLIEKLPNITGIVIGALNKDYTINEKFLEDVNKVKGHLKITFHKAFDQVKDFEESLKILEKHNIDTVLTSGGPDIVQGLKVIENLSKLKLNIQILIGGGVTKDNLNDCLKASKNIHIGLAARQEKSWASDISIENINSFKG